MTSNCFDVMASDELNFDSFLDEVSGIDHGTFSVEPSFSGKQITNNTSPHSMTSEEEVDVINTSASVNNEQQILLSESFKTFDLNTFTQQLQQFNVNNNSAFANGGAQQFDVSMFEQFFRQQQQLEQPQHASVVVDQQPAVIFTAPVSAFAQNNVLLKRESSPVADSKKEQPAKKTRNTKRAKSTSPSTSKSPQTSSANSSPASSEQATNENTKENSSGDDEKQPTTLDEKELKRQRRLIKNRESAQASRERKKSYLHGLEQKCNDLSSQNTSLSNRLLLLEEENFRLREQLKRVDHNEVFQDVEPDSKRLRRPGQLPAPKMPLPRNPNSAATYNPLNPHFWQQFMSAFGNANGASGVSVALSAATGSTAQPEVVQGSWSQLPAKGIVLFVMLFCVAFLIGTTRNGAVFNSNTANNNFDVDSQYEAKRIGRKILELSNVNNIPLQGANSPISQHPKMSQQEFASKFKQLYEQFNQHFEDENALVVDPVVQANAAHPQAVVGENKLFAEQEDNFAVHVDKQTNNLVITIPINQQGKAAENITISQKLLESMCQYLKRE